MAPVVMELSDEHASTILQELKMFWNLHESTNETKKIVHYEQTTYDDNVDDIQRLTNVYQLQLKKLQREYMQGQKLLSEILIFRQQHFRQFLSERNHTSQELDDYLWKMADSIPLFVKPTAYVHSLVGGVSVPTNFSIRDGSLIAAFVDDLWILGIVAERVSQTLYNVDDIDEQDPVKRYKSVTRGCIIPLPLFRAHPCTHRYALFPKDAYVLALRPQTTVFYKARVMEVPSTPLERYNVCFLDDHSVALVPQMFVVNVVEFFNDE